MGFKNIQKAIQTADAQRITNLEKQIIENAQKYYTDGSQELSDAEFDNLTDELRTLKPDSEVLKTGWGYDVNDDSTPGNKVRHKYGEAGSLDKVHNYQELPPSLKNINLWASLKLDGMSVVLYYEEGHLVQALTRGDGEVGIDITAKVSNILQGRYSIPDRQFTGAVRGEIVMSFANFEKFKEGKEDVKNPRNSTTGLINGNEITEDYKYLDIVVYRVVGKSSQCSSFFDNTYKSMSAWLQYNFPKCAYFAEIDRRNLTESNLISTMQSLRDDWYGMYPADGIVLTRNDIQYSETSEEITFESRAFKFPAEIKETTVVDIEWSLTKTKLLYPRVKVEPVELSGSTVQYASGFNAQYIEKNSLGPGAKVTLMRSGEVIPDIQEVIHGSPNYCLPITCPECGHELVRKGVHLMCPNPDCTDAVMQDLLVWSNTLAPTDGLGDVLRVKFYRNIFGDNVSIESVMIKIQNEDPLTWSNYGSVQVLTFLDSLAVLKHSTFDLTTALVALNIPRLGDKTADKLSKFPDLVKDIIDGKIEAYEALPELRSAIGTANGDSVAANLSKLKRLNLIKNQIKWYQPTVTANRGTVVITGKLSCKRSDFEKGLKAHGWTIGSSVTASTDFLITDDPNSFSSKNITATKLGVVKVTESDFRTKYL